MNHQALTNIARQLAEMGFECTLATLCAEARTKGAIITLPTTNSGVVGDSRQVQHASSGGLSAMDGRGGSAVDAGVSPRAVVAAPIATNATTAVAIIEGCDPDAVCAATVASADGRFHCKFCANKSFTLRTNLKRHLLSHAGMHRHNCVTCGRGFGRADECAAHMRTCSATAAAAGAGGAPAAADGASLAAPTSRSTSSSVGVSEAAADYCIKPNSRRGAESPASSESTISLTGRSTGSSVSSFSSSSSISSGGGGTHSVSSSSSSSSSSSAAAASVSVFAQRGGSSSSSTSQHQSHQHQHVSCHVHSAGCGHPPVKHGDHLDFLVGDSLHHQHNHNPAWCATGEGRGEGGRGHGHPGAAHHQHQHLLPIDDSAIEGVEGDGGNGEGLAPGLCGNPLLLRCSSALSISAADAAAAAAAAASSSSSSVLGKRGRGSDATSAAAGGGASCMGPARPRSLSSLSMGSCCEGSGMLGGGGGDAHCHFHGTIDDIFGSSFALLEGLTAGGLALAGSAPASNPV